MMETVMFQLLLHVQWSEWSQREEQTLTLCLSSRMENMQLNWSHTLCFWALQFSCWKAESRLVHKTEPVLKRWGGSQLKVEFNSLNLFTEVDFLKEYQVKICLFERCRDRTEMVVVVKPTHLYSPAGFLQLIDQSLGFIVDRHQRTDSFIQLILRSDMKRAGLVRTLPDFML